MWGLLNPVVLCTIILSGRHEREAADRELQATRT